MCVGKFLKCLYMFMSGVMKSLYKCYLILVTVLSKYEENINVFGRIECSYKAAVKCVVYDAYISHIVRSGTKGLE